MDPAVQEYEPAEHILHSVDRPEPLNVPAGHRVHVLLPCTDENVPGRHSLHDVPEVMFE